MNKGRERFCALAAFPPCLLNFGQTLGWRHAMSTPSQDPAIIFRLCL
jgi:hypothetical protein